MSDDTFGQAPGASGTGLTSISGAVSDLFTGFGDLEEAAGYTKAADIEGQNVQLAEESTRLQEYAASRQELQAQGTTRAEVGGAGFAESGSALDILRSNAEQGALNKQLVGVQGQITQNNFEEQQAAYKSLASQAQTAAEGSFIGGAFDLIGALI